MTLLRRVNRVMNRRDPRYVSSANIPPVVRRAQAGKLKEVPAYEAISQVYDDVWVPPSLENLLPSLVEKLGRNDLHILDLACGTGMLSRALAPSAYRVHGVDRSKPMLEIARQRCADHANITFELGDMRSFHEPGPFHLVFCGSNSLNYLIEAGGLEACLRHVEHCMAPKSFLIFEVVNELGMKHLNGRVQAITDSGPFLSFQYDSEKRRESSLAIIGDEVERHQRVPIDPEDVEAVAERVGLRIWNRWRFAQLGPWMVSVGMGTVLGPMLIGLLRRLGMTFDGLSHDYYVLSKGSVD